ncbi:MAG: methionyl-tRNA formyltransferase, partial [Acidimicrobiia bacterium]
DVPAGQVRRHIRAFSPKPGAWAELDGAPLRILGAGDIDGGGGPAGTVIEEAGRVWLWCGEGRVQLTTVHPGGGRRVDAASWWHGRRGRTTHLV